MKPTSPDRFFSWEHTLEAVTRRFPDAGGWSLYSSELNGEWVPDSRTFGHMVDSDAVPKRVRLLLSFFGEREREVHTFDLDELAFSERHDITCSNCGCYSGTHHVKEAAISLSRNLCGACANQQFFGHETAADRDAAFAVELAFAGEEGA